MATDPFALIAQFGNMQSQRAAQEDSAAQNALLQVFQEEAARQRPYAVMPAQLAAANISGDAKLGRAVTLAGTRASLKGQRRHKKGSDPQDGTTLDTSVGDDGTEYETVIVGGKKIKVPKDS